MNAAVQDSNVTIFQNMLNTTLQFPTTGYHICVQNLLKFCYISYNSFHNKFSLIIILKRSKLRNNNAVAFLEFELYEYKIMGYKKY